MFVNCSWPEFQHVHNFHLRLSHIYPLETIQHKRLQNHMFYILQFITCGLYNSKIAALYQLALQPVNELQ